LEACYSSSGKLGENDSYNEMWENATQTKQYQPTNDLHRSPSNLDIS